MTEEDKGLFWLDDVEDKEEDINSSVLVSAANRLIGEVVQSRRRPLLGPSPG